MKRKKLLALTFVIVIVLVFINFGRTLHFSLAGDDWLALYRYYTDFPSRSSYFNPSNYMGNYDASNIIMGEIAYAFGFNPLPYYLISMIGRILAAFTLFLVVEKLTKDKKASFFSAIFFSCMYAGVESTNWVFNMATYFSMTLFNLFLLVYDFKSKRLLDKNVIISLFFIFASFYIMPVRMHGAILTLPIALFLLRRVYSKQVDFKLIFIHSILFILPIAYFYKSTSGQYQSGYLEKIVGLLSLKYHFFFLPFAEIGATLLPDKIISFFVRNISYPHIADPEVFWRIAGLLLLGLFLLLRYLRKHFAFSKKFLRIVAGIPILLFLLFWLSMKSDVTGIFHNLVITLDVLVGIIAVIFLASFFTISPKSINKSKFVGLYFLIVSISLFGIPWILFPTATFASDTRYLLIPGAYLTASICIVVSSLLKKGTVSRYIPFVLVSILFLTINIYSLQSYFQHSSEEGRLQKDHLRVANIINAEVPVLDANGTSVFLFTGPDDVYMYNTIRFGFPYYMLLNHRELNLNSKIAPFPADNFASLTDVFDNEKSTELIRYGYEPMAIPVERVYSFEINKDEVTNTSLETRNKLMKMKQNQ